MLNIVSMKNRLARLPIDYRIRREEQALRGYGALAKLFGDEDIGMVVLNILWVSGVK